MAEGLEQFCKTFTEQLGSLKEEQGRFRKTFDVRLGAEICTDPVSLKPD